MKICHAVEHRVFLRFTMKGYTGKIGINEICSQYEIMNSAKHSLIKKNGSNNNNNKNNNNNNNQNQQQPKTTTTKKQHKQNPVILAGNPPTLPQTLSAALKVAKSASPLERSSIWVFPKIMGFPPQIIHF